MRVPVKGEIWVFGTGSDQIRDKILIVDSEDVCYTDVNGGDVYIMPLERYLRSHRPLYTKLEQHLKDVK
jgi:hypothetical protein